MNFWAFNEANWRGYYEPKTNLSLRYQEMTLFYYKALNLLNALSSYIILFYSSLNCLRCRCLAVNIHLNNTYKYFLII